ncbi:DUF3306 domain-containing protein [Bradyrhizobium amphicarpaeae]|uniref:DUF3306 domain-containing protein n=1 Tax=Bradyrhizobium amphicarpaeae TaxID=1404768 RepID=A0A2U8PYL7_9BRAD|nr:DUF3306 domain-containing protein [Bradyrhizobium amphicarpaeae]AWM02887.1 DUF3306 domain-containing protein [Bradyrhizobium amphicarpaeae]
MPDRNVFLRWARLKQASKNADAGQAEVKQAAEPSAGDVASEPPFDLASLPTIESIAAHTDIAAFLNTGVPAELTRAALRRAWATDPAIRDFIGIAENQWDFNDPNAIPGFGPLDPSDNVADLVARVTNGLKQVPDVLADVPPPSDPVRQDPVKSEQPVLEPTISAIQSSPDDTVIAATDNQDAAEQPDDLATTALPSQPRRRHGSALPR